MVNPPLFPSASHEFGADAGLLGMMIAHLCPAGGSPAGFSRHEIAVWMRRWIERLSEDERKALRGMLDKGTTFDD